MLNRTTLARPYARAAFLSASEHGALDRWSQNLEIAAQIVLHDEVGMLLGNPRYKRDAALEVFRAVGGERFDATFQSFLQTLDVYRRLALLPEILAQFQALRREAEQRVHVLVTSAHALSDEETQLLSERLAKRFGREVEMQVEIDASLIGGAIIRAHDEVIDGSVRGQLARLARQVAA
ncbi:MAG: F0F1 ATP synthase subunit delta [Wenzhouxiangella sp.]